MNFFGFLVQGALLAACIGAVIQFPRIFPRATEDGLFWGPVIFVVIYLVAAYVSLHADSLKSKAKIAAEKKQREEATEARWQAHTAAKNLAHAREADPVYQAKLLREQQQRKDLVRGRINEKLVCKFCQQSKCVRVKLEATQTEKYRVNSVVGSALGVGVNKKTTFTELHCDNCDMSWPA